MADRRGIKLVSGNREMAEMVSLSRAEALVASGRYRWASDGTRRIIECYSVKPRDARHWRKVTQRSKSGAALYSTMQLVPGCESGRNTGGPNPHKQ